MFARECPGFSEPLAAPRLPKGQVRTWNDDEADVEWNRDSQMCSTSCRPENIYRIPYLLCTALNRPHVLLPTFQPGIGGGLGAIRPSPGATSAEGPDRALGPSWLPSPAHAWRSRAVLGFIGQAIFKAGSVVRDAQ